MKRALDILISAPLLAILSPIILLVAIGVAIDVGTPVFFRQTRPGLHGRPFDILKFRTMRNSRTADGRDRPDSERLTRFGCWLRATSLDELPELWNVIRGDMSLVGPRPLLMHYLPLYSDEQMRRHDVRPGLTGWAQVNGRNALTWEEKFRHDLWYIENRSLRLDLRILLLTAKSVIGRHGISHGESATMPEFKGSGTNAAPRDRGV